ncbi:MAG TPA: FesM [Thermoanaerobaculia bacterium]|nr:FesM [Thermoanaerobaculia bacterium]
MTVVEPLPASRRPAGQRPRSAARLHGVARDAVPGTDLLRWPLVGALLRWRWARVALQLPLLAIAVLMVAHGLLGPQLAPKNLATLLGWVHYRGLLVLVLLIAGNVFCMACPFMLPRNLLRRWVEPRWRWPRWLRGKWLAIALFVAVLFAYELFDLWGSPAWTAWLIVGYFAAALVVDGLFRGASFCKHVCPVGQFNFVASTVSPLEVRVRDTAVCQSCTTMDCIRGTREGGEAAGDAGGPLRVTQRGCELALFQPYKAGNMDCTFCLDCIHACPHDNVGLSARLPASELWEDPKRSGVGRFGSRPDLAALVLVFTFGALLNAFAMVSPVYALQEWLAGVLGKVTPALGAEAPVLAALFFAGLVVEPVVLLGLAAWATRAATGQRDRTLVELVTRYAYALVPLGFGVWLAHYSFHLFTGLWTFVPVLQDLLADAGLPLLGAPDWRLGGLTPAAVDPLETGFLLLGLTGTLLVAFRIARREHPQRPWGAFLPWAGLATVLFVAALWLLAQPMEMRGSFLGS